MSKYNTSIAPMHVGKVRECNYLRYTKYIPLPDLCNHGPIVSQFDPSSVDTSIILNSSKKAIHPPWYAATPISLPVNYSKVSRNYMTKQLILENSLLHGRGNILCNSSDASRTLYSVANVNKTAVIREYSVEEDKEILNLTEKNAFTSPRPIFDIQMKTLQENTFILTRNKTFIDIFKVIDNDLALCYTNKVSEDSHFFTKSVFSPHDSLNWLELDDSGKLFLYESSSKDPLWKDDLGLNKKFEWSTVTFCSDAESALVANSVNVYKLDFRMNSKTNVYINQGDFSEMLKISPLCELVSLPDTNYFYTITCDQTILWDERSCKLPLLSTNHMLKDRPRRAAQFKSGKIRMLSLSNELEHRVSMNGLMYDTKTHTGEGCVESLGLTKHYQFIEPLVNYAKSNGLFFYEEMDRVLSRITGQCFITYRKTDSFYTLLSNEVGDIFCKQFILREGKDSTSIDEVLEKKINAKLSEWQDFILGVEAPKVLANTFNISKSGVDGRSKRGRPFKTVQASRGVEEDGTWNLQRLAEGYFDSSTFKALQTGKRSLNWKDILVLDYEDEVEKDKKHILTKKESDNPADTTGDSQKIVNKIDEEYIESCIDPLANKIQTVFPVTDIEFPSSYHSIPYNEKVAATFGAKLDKVKPLKQVKVKRAAKKVPVQIEQPQVVNTPALDVSQSLSDFVSSTPIPLTQLFPTSQFASVKKTPRVFALQNSMNLSMNGSYIQSSNPKKRKKGAAGF